MKAAQPRGGQSHSRAVEGKSRRTSNEVFAPGQISQLATLSLATTGAFVPDQTCVPRQKEVPALAAEAVGRALTFANATVAPLTESSSSCPSLSCSLSLQAASECRLETSRAATEPPIYRRSFENELVIRFRVVVATWTGSASADVLSQSLMKIPKRISQLQVCAMSKAVL
jgi:hypothetical protein